MSPEGEDTVRAAAAALVAAILAAVADAAPTGNAPERYLSIDQAVALTGCGRSLLYGEIQAGRLHSIKIGRRRLIGSTAIAEFIASNQMPAPVSETTRGGRGGGTRNANPDRAA